MIWEPILVGALIILIGLLGIIVPVLPGLLLVWAGTVVWAWLSPGDLPWLFVAIASALYLAGLIAQFLIPGRFMKGSGVRWRTQAIGLAGAVVGAIVIPAVGFFIGFPVAVFLTEFATTRRAGESWRRMIQAIKGLGLNMFVELLTGFAIAATFIVGVLVS